MSRDVGQDSATTKTKNFGGIDDLVAPLKWNLFGHPLAGFSLGTITRKFAIRHLMEERTNRKCLYVHQVHGLFLSLDVDDFKMVRRNGTSGTYRKGRRQKSTLKIQRHLRKKLTLGCALNDAKVDPQAIQSRAPKLSR